MALQPEDEAIRLHTLELAVYIDNEGKQQIEWQWSGEEVLAMHAIGYLEAAKLGMYHEQQHGTSDDY